MNKNTLNILVVILFLGFVSTSHALDVKPGSGDTNQVIQKYYSKISAGMVLSYNENLLERSPIAHNLKISNNPADKAHYSKAMGIYRKASKTYQTGNDIEAKRLAIKSIRTIAKAVPQFYNRIAIANSK